MIVYAINKKDKNYKKYSSIDNINENEYDILKISGTDQRTKCFGESC